MTGRWLSRDLTWNANYCFVENTAFVCTDYIGLILFNPLVFNPLRLIPPFWDADVNGFGEMFFFAMLRARSYKLSNAGKAYGKIVEEFKQRIEGEALKQIDCSVREFSPVRKELAGENYHFGGSLFSNPLSSNWGPRTYNFYTVGNVTITQGYYSIEGRKLEDEGSSCCCFAMSFDVDIEFTDVFDFVPDRSWLTWSGFRYNILALPFSYVYNERLGASRPTVNAHIKEHWGKLLCGKE